MFENLATFSLDEYGYAAIVHLVGRRVEHDVQLTESERHKILTDDSLIQKLLGTFSKSAEDLESEILQKRDWLKQWQTARWETAQGIRGTNANALKEIQNASFESIMKRYDADSELRLKKFLILQEALLYPLYSSEKSTAAKVKERDPDGSAGHLSRLCGFPNEHGKSILNETEKFIWLINDFWKNLFTLTVIGAAIAALSFGAAGPAIGTAIGGLMGLHGAAAFSAGMALLGGGSLAAGGAGIAGGFVVLVGFGVLAGASSGAGSAVLFRDIPPDAVGFLVAKMINYLRFLETARPLNDIAPILSEMARTEFLDLKHKVEASLFDEHVSPQHAENIFKTVHVLQCGYKVYAESAYPTLK